MLNQGSGVANAGSLRSDTAEMGGKAYRAETKPKCRLVSHHWVT
ncbi:hypothetical protein ACT691_01300 [Vibrio metschnikovii]